MKTTIIAFLAAFSFFATAEEKNCSVKGMHCEACVTMVKEKLCNDKFEVCEVTMGKVHLKTKEVGAKIEAKEMSKAIADTTYTIDKCTPVKGKG